MLRILIVKTTSMGDVIHALPVLEDIRTHFPDAIIDWMVEVPFIDLVKANKHVHEVIPVQLRVWRQQGIQYTYRMWRQLRHSLSNRTYDFVIDLQGLIKSACLSCAAKGRRVGPSFCHAREPLASFFYHQHAGWDKQSHAVDRLRQFTAHVLEYPCAEQAVFYESIGFYRDARAQKNSREIWFLHASARPEKKWPVQFWCDLAQRFCVQGYTIVLPWGSFEEKNQAESIAKQSECAVVLPHLSLAALSERMHTAQLVVGVDTGLTHLAAALYLPMVALFLATPAWRFAPKFNPYAIALGDQGVMPSVDEVFDASNMLLKGV